MIELNDEDRAAIERIHNTVLYYDAEREAIYRAGIIAGLERAAKVCENHTCGSSYPLHLEGQIAACRACASAIRALIGDASE